MEFIKELSIKHFKSIKSMSMDCKRINVFIGKPNVGKSNILEAISLLGSEYSQENETFLSDLIRFDSLPELFHWKNRSLPIEVNTNIGVARLRFHMSQINAYDLIVGHDPSVFEWIKTLVF